MKVSLYAVFDSASGVYDGPVPAQADGTAMRNFCDLAVNAEHPIGKHPECYTLFRVGSWNDGTGEIVTEVPVKLINGVEAVANSRNVDREQIEMFGNGHDVVHADNME